MTLSTYLIVAAQRARTVVLVWLVVASTAFTGMALAAPDHVEASALIVATELRIPTQQFPNAARTIFGSATLAQSVIDENEFDITPRQLILDRVLLREVGVSVTLQVVGTGEDPRRAALYATAVARQLVAELNMIEGLGTFRVFQDASAARAVRPVSLPKLPIAFLAGALAAGAVPVVSILARRPVHSLSTLRSTVPGLPLFPLRAGDHAVPQARQALQQLPGTGASATTRYIPVGGPELRDMAAALSVQLNDEPGTGDRQSILLVQAGATRSQICNAVALHTPVAIMVVVGRPTAGP